MDNATKQKRTGSRKTGDSGHCSRVKVGIHDVDVDEIFGDYTTQRFAEGRATIEESLGIRVAVFVGAP